ncbi:MAG: nitrous oxide reductase accessory protein NosL [Gemmatimonadota bacterium]|nr:nitrous oxide reductase accessory protein NosL [Gemmatimonadota bacterium]
MRRLVPPRRTVLAALSALVLLAGCGAQEPRPIALNEDQCGYCRMTISDARFGGEAVLPTGRVMAFDAIECLISWARSTPAADRGALFVIDVQHPGNFVPAETAGFLLGGTMRTPMGGSIIAFADAARAEEQRTMLGGQLRSWAQLLADSTTAVAGEH